MARRAGRRPRASGDPAAPRAGADRVEDAAGDATREAPGDRAGLAPRRAALRLLDAVTGEGMLLTDARAAALVASLPPEGRARAQRLAVEALRGLGRADLWLAPRLRRPPPPTVLNALRLAAAEIGAGEAAHGVVNAAVAILGESGRTERFRGLANAVLRQIAAEGPEAWARLPPPPLPTWLREPLVAAWGEDATAAMEAAHLGGAPLDLSAKGDAAALARDLGGVLLPTGSVRLPGAPQVTALPGFHEGAFWVQDAAAALPAQLLGARPGERVLDLCAAPGGKTMQLAATGAAVTAVDSSAPRLERLRENLSRTSLRARVAQADALDFDEGGWDAILLDAPCSASGTIRRHPDLPHARDGREAPALLDLQRRLLDHAVRLLAPGGRLVFATCSILPAEGEDQLAALLARRPDLAVEPPDAPGLDPAWTAAGPWLRTRPDHWGERGGLDGFFAAHIRAP